MNPPSRDRAVEPFLGDATRQSLGAEGLDCATPETIAAWIDGGLSATERARLELHLAECGHCQALLAMCARASGEVEPAASRVVPAAAAGWTSRLARYVAPLAAAAVVVIGVWLGRGSPAEPVGQRQAEPASAAVPRQERPAAQAPRSPLAKAEAPRASRTVPGGAERDIAQPEATARALPEAIAEAPLSTLARAAPPSAAGVAADSAANSARQDDAQPLEAATSRQRSAVPSAPAARLADSRAQTAWTVVAPAGGGPRWRFSSAAVEFSADGTAWTGVSIAGALAADIRAGSSPSAGVIWLVGRDGLVLLASAGSSFVHVTAPAATVLVSVEARDASSAVVRGADGRQWRTGDGGRSWGTVP